MHFLIDNLIATIMAGAIFLILVGVNHRKQDAGFEAVNFYSLRTQQVAFIDMVKRDMQNVTRLEATTENQATNEFIVYALPEPTALNEQKIIYRRVPVPNTQFFQIERWVEQNGLLTRDGQSPPTVAFWHIVGRNAANQVVGDPDAATQVYVRFETAPPFREGRTIKRARWDAAFRPPMIQPNIAL